MQGNDQRRRLRAIVALWNVQQVLPLLTGGDDGTGGGAGPIREVENGVEKSDSEQDQENRQANDNQHCTDHDLPAIHKWSLNLRVSNGRDERPSDAPRPLSLNLLPCPRRNLT